MTRFDGSGVTFKASLVRNLMRVLYVFPLFYLVDAADPGSKRNQRLGDLLAGTLVVRERLGELSTPMPAGAGRIHVLWSAPHTSLYPAGPPGPSAPRLGVQRLAGYRAWVGPPGSDYPGVPPWARTRGSLPPELASWDVTAVTQADLAAVHAFLARRFQYDPQARQSPGRGSCRAGIYPKVAGLTVPMDAERFWRPWLWSSRHEVE